MNVGVQRSSQPQMVHWHYGTATKLPYDDEWMHCVVTSPPYNTKIDYPVYDDWMEWPLYEAVARKAAAEMYRVLVPGGRAWVNVMPTVPIYPWNSELLTAPDAPQAQSTGNRYPLAHSWLDALGRAGFLYRDTVVWIQDSFDGGCAWGSWRKPSAPNLRGDHEVILSVYKPSDGEANWKRQAPEKWAHKKKVGRVKKSWEDDDDEFGGEWTELVRNVWKMNPASGGYPARFPIELPYRAIRLSTWPGERVLDPFAGAGTTGEAARRLGREAHLVELKGADQ